MSPQSLYGIHTHTQPAESLKAVKSIQVSCINIFFSGGFTAQQSTVSLILKTKKAAMFLNVKCEKPRGEGELVFPEFLLI